MPAAAVAVAARAVRLRPHLPQAPAPVDRRPLRPALPQFPVAAAETLPALCGTAATMQAPVARRPRALQDPWKNLTSARLAVSPSNLRATCKSTRKPYTKVYGLIGVICVVPNLVKREISTSITLRSTPISALSSATCRSAARRLPSGTASTVTWKPIPVALPVPAPAPQSARHRLPAVRQRARRCLPRLVAVARPRRPRHLLVSRIGNKKSARCQIPPVSHFIGSYYCYYHCIAQGARLFARSLIRDLFRDTSQLARCVFGRHIPHRNSNTTLSPSG